MSFKSYSQCFQDVFVNRLLGDSGTFLDIGASHPTELSNTYGLEQVGWTGVCVEIEPTLCELLRKQRTARVIQADARDILFPEPEEFSYLSLDVDEPTLDVLKSLPLQRLKFRVITIEHDAYRFFDTLRLPEREILTKAGYVLVAPDVANKETPDMPFEDFWCSKELADKAREILKTLWL